jgi:DNA-binding NtrC family response regulator
MKQDVTELKKLVFQLLSSDQDEQLLQKHKGLFKNIEEESDTRTYILSNGDQSDNAFDMNSAKSSKSEDDMIEDISHETEPDDSLSIEKKERELIIKALQKNNNKRKYAAQDLGISERTLYRKIKQYQIDE